MKKSNLSYFGSFFLAKYSLLTHWDQKLDRASSSNFILQTYCMLIAFQNPLILTYTFYFLIIEVGSMCDVFIEISAMKIFW